MSEKYKNLELGDIELVDLSNDEELDLVFNNIYANSENVTAIPAYAGYGTTSGCSDSCGSSTDCC